jgi:hypothetical protein
MARYRSPSVRGGSTNVCRRDDVLGTVLTAAPRRQSASYVPVVIELDHGNRFADDEGIARDLDVVFQGLPERREFLAVVGGVDDNRLDDRVERRAGWRLHGFSFCVLVSPDRGSVSG